MICPMLLERDNVKIPLPCNFGNIANCEGKQLPLIGVSWFRWGRGMEYTYFFSVDNPWNDSRFYTTYLTEQPYSFYIPDGLLTEKKIQEHGYPLKGTGYAFGVFYINSKTYIDFIMTSNYFAHINVQCDGAGHYVPGGDIIFPPSWDTEEKQERVLLKSINFIKGKPLIVKEPKPVQLSLFDFMNS